MKETISIFVVQLLMVPYVESLVSIKMIVMPVKNIVLK